MSETQRPWYMRLAGSLAGSWKTTAFFVVIALASWTLRYWLPRLIGSDESAAELEKLSRAMVRRPPSREARMIHQYDGKCPPGWKTVPQEFYSNITRRYSAGCELAGSDPNANEVIDYISPQEKAFLHVTLK